VDIEDRKTNLSSWALTAEVIAETIHEASKDPARQNSLAERFISKFPDDFDGDGFVMVALGLLPDEG
jgi:hypothetical protein